MVKEQGEFLQFCAIPEIGFEVEYESFVQCIKDKNYGA